MIRLSVVYPRKEGGQFDFEYYVQKHLSLAKSLLGHQGLVRLEADKPVGGLDDSPAPFMCIGHAYFNSLKDLQKGMQDHAQEFMADVPNYTNIEPHIQISEIETI